MNDWSENEVLNYVVENHMGLFEFFFSHPVNGNAFLRLTREDFVDLNLDENDVQRLLEDIQRREVDVQSIDVTGFSTYRNYKRWTSSCGYCHQGTNTMFGGYLYNVSPEHFEILLDAGWMRSGTMIYFPVNEECCCPQYQIRLNVNEFKMNKKQKKVMRKTTRWMQGIKGKNTKTKKIVLSSSELATEKTVKEAIQSVLDALIEENVLEPCEVKITVRTRNNCFYSPVALSLASKQVKSSIEIGELIMGKLTQKYPWSINLDEKGFVIFQNVDGIDETMDVEQDEEHEYSEEPQSHIYNKSFHPPEVTEEIFLLYKKYQVVVHDDNPDKVTVQSFTGHLINTPILGDSSQFLHIRIDGVLVGVSCIDFLPNSLHSVYFFWDPDYRSILSLGMFTILEEIEIAKERNLEYYYLGWHVHECAKMIYKPELYPSQLLCPYTFTYLYYDEVYPLFKHDKGPRLNLTAPLKPPPTEEQIDQLVIHYQGSYHRFGHLKYFLDPTETESIFNQIQDFLSKYPLSISNNLIFTPKMFF